MLRFLVVGVHSRTEALAFALRHQLIPSWSHPPAEIFAFWADQ